MKAILILCSILILNCNIKKERIEVAPTNELKWLLTGLPDELKAENVVAKLYGFQFIPFGGCVVSEKRMDSINKKNKIVKTFLSNKYGKKWRDDFDKRVKYIDSIIHL